MPLLFALDMSKKHNIVFKFNQKESKWYVEFGEQEQKIKRGAK